VAEPQVLIPISDLHCGSSVAIAPPEVYGGPDGSVIKTSKISQWYWGKWRASLDWAREIINGDPYIVVVNGDCIDGVHHKTKQLYFHDPGKQCDIFDAVCGRLLKDAAAVWFVKGTESHTFDIEERLGATYSAVPSKMTGAPAWEMLDLEFCGRLLNFKHHCGSSKRGWLESGEPGRVIANEIFNRHRAEWQHADIFFRAHRHVAYWGGDLVNTCCITSAWQWLTRYGHKVVAESIPIASMQLLDFRGVSKTQSPRHHSIVFKPKEAGRAFRSNVQKELQHV